MSLLNFLLLPSLALAATFQAPSDDSFSLGVPVSDDLYIVGGSLSIDEPISEDLVIAGGDIVIRESIGQDLVAAGGRLVVRGRVGDDIRITGGDVRIEGDVGDDVIVAAGQVVLDEDSTIRGDVVVIGGEVIVDATVLGSVKVRGGRVVLNGNVQGDVDLQAEDITTNGSILGSAVIVPGERWMMNDDFSIRGDLRYWHPDGEQALGTRVQGQSVYDADLKPFIAKHERKAGLALKGMILGMMGYSVLSAALLILIVVLLSKKMLPSMVKRIEKRRWRCTLLGLAYIAVLPLVALLFTATLIGMPIGILIIVLYGFQLFFALPFTALVLAKWVEIHKKYKWNRAAYFFASVGMYILLKFVSLLPVVGWVAVFLLVCTAFGAGLMAKWEALDKIR